jgi:lipopolysaccharide heptosyltransferase II
MINNSFKRILIFNVNWLGDVLFTTAAIRALRKQYPDSHIACVAPERCREILELNPHINEIISFDERKTNKSIPSKIEFVYELKKKNFDVVFLFHRSFTRLFLVWLAGIKRRVGYDRKKLSFLLTDKIPPVDRDSLHRVDYFLNLVRPFCEGELDRSYALKVSNSDSEYIKRLLKENQIEEKDQLIILNPGANWVFKRWPVEHFAKLSDLLQDKFKIKIIISGSDKDIDLAEQIKSLSKKKITIFTGKTNLKQLAALFKMSKLVVSADSGPMHIAIAVGTRTVSLFGPTSSKITGPYDLNLHTVVQKKVDCVVPCFDVVCGDGKCMKEILPQDVFDVIVKLGIFS